ncbi:3-ketoacyl-ACP reductase [Klebsiella pneumoniae]|nr:3-ketoacyl-ACP reductase [Klebsiella pneumoniae]
MARVVVITGGGTGIGAACARLMRAAGDRVFITGRREAPLQAVANETGATALVGDAADGEGVAPAAAAGHPRPDRRD